MVDPLLVICEGFLITISELLQSLNQHSELFLKLGHFLFLPVGGNTAIAAGSRQRFDSSLVGSIVLHLAGAVEGRMTFHLTLEAKVVFPVLLAELFPGAIS